jgi:hypothetical protein
VQNLKLKKMKTILMMLTFLLGVSQVNAQKVKEADVPAAVKKTFATHYSTVKEAKWEKEGNNYEAEFDLNKVETSVLIDPSGNLMETETEIAVAELPQPASAYITKNLKDQKIKETAKIIDAKGIVTYEAEVGSTDYLFDSKGNFIKKD